MRIRTRLLVILLVVVLTGSASTILLVRASLEADFRSFIYSGDLEKAKIYAGLLGQYYSEKNGWGGIQDFLSELPALLIRRLDDRLRSDETLKVVMSERIAVADAAGIVVADTSGVLLGTMHPGHHLVNGVAVNSASGRVGTVLVGSMIDSSLTDRGMHYLDSISASLAFAALLSGLVAFGLGLVFIMRLARPIAALTGAAQSVAAGDLSVKVPVRGKDELAILSSSFNAMTEALRRLESARRQLIADSAHELRTPVNLIQGTIEAMLDGVFPTDAATLESVHEETRRLARLIDMLRELELIDAGKLVLRRESVDLVELARRDILMFASLAQEKNIALDWKPPAAPLPVLRLDATRIQQIIFNLLSNALRYTPEGGSVSLSVEPGRAKGEQALRVDDSGPGIPLAERGRVFERFYRLDSGRSAERGGSGLGLSIAAELAKAHGGGIEIADSPLGGAGFILRLPGA